MSGNGGAAPSDPQASPASLTPATLRPKPLRILHFNDVYEIFPRDVEPVGGAARFVHAIRGQTTADTLVLFSGDAFNPSLLSSLTCGEHMVGVLNAVGVHAACVGNHDFDFGIDQLRSLASRCSFPWLLSNVLVNDGSVTPPAGLARSCLLETASGTRVGVVGLVERDWLATVPCLDGGLDGGLEFLDPVVTARELALKLRSQGADLVLALTHQRAARDTALAAAAPELQLVLGGHDHHWAADTVPPYETLVIKSGTDFRELTVLDLQVGVDVDGLSGDASADGTGEAVMAGSVDASTANAGCPPPSGAAIDSSGHHRPCSPAIPPRPNIVAVARLTMDSTTPEDPATAALVAAYASKLGDQLDLPLGWTHVTLDARSGTMRRGETALGNLLADAMKAALGCDVAVLNAGTVRSDRVHAAGQLTLRDVSLMLPFTDELMVVEVTGSELEAVLETGVGAWPAEEGRFLQVSGLRFCFDSRNPCGRRLVPGSCMVNGLPLDPGRRYTLAGKQYICSGRDGFEVLRGARALPRPPVDWPSLATLMRHLFGRVEALNEGLVNDDGGGGYGVRVVGGDCAEPVTALSTDGEAINHVTNTAAAHPPGPATLPAQALLQPFEPALLALIVYDAAIGKYGVAPCVEGRILRVDDGTAIPGPEGAP